MSPTASSHFATKGYVDGQSSSIINQFSQTLLYQTTVPLGNNVTIPAGTLTSFESRICYSIQIQSGSAFSTTSSGYPSYGFACQDTI